MFRMMSLLSVYFFSQFLLKDVMRKWVTPFLVSTSADIVQLTMRAVVLTFVGTAFLAAGLMGLVYELVRMGMDSGIFYWSPLLATSLIFLTLGAVGVSLAAFTRIWLPRAYRMQYRPPEHTFVDGVTGLIQTIMAEMERQRHTSPPPSRPESAWEAPNSPPRPKEDVSSQPPIH